MSVAETAQLIKDNGGRYAAKITSRVTHLIASLTDIDNEAPKDGPSLL